LSDGTYIKTINLEDVKKYNAKLDSNFPYQKKIDNLPIPTLKEVFEWIKTTNYPNKDTIKFSIEVKTNSDLDTDEEVQEFVEKVMGIIKNSNISENRIIIQSRDERALYYIRKISQTIPTSYLIENDDDDGNRNDINDTTIQQAKELKANIVSPDYMLLNKEKVDNLHKHGFKVVPWTVNNLEDLKIVLTYGIDGVITDYPKMIIDYLNEKK
jgi:glycerophosphoryl diester phosphodiesterase